MAVETQTDYPTDLYQFSRVAEGVQGFAGVTEAHLDQFRDEGYLVVHEAFTPAETDGGA